MRRTMVGLCIAVLAWNTAVIAADPRWDLPPPVAESWLPKLARPLVLDGDLGEWAGAAAIPIRFASYIAWQAPNREWKGPADSGMEALAAWSDDGLCLAGLVTDDDLRNSRPVEQSWEQDGVELYVDGRGGERFLHAPYSAGAYQFLVRPPADGKEIAIGTNPAHGKVDGVRIAGKLIPGGYAFEVLVPWSAFPGFTAKPGSAIGLQFGLNDYDARDGTLSQPLQMTWQAARRLSANPAGFIRWTLADTFPTGPGASLAAVAALDVTTPFYEGSEARITIEAGRTLGSLVKSAVYEVKDWAGTSVLLGSMPLKSDPAPWGGAVSGSFTCPLGTASDGVYRVEAAILDEKGSLIGKWQRNLLLVRRDVAEGISLVSQCIKSLEKADLPKLAQEQPFRAKAWVGAAACAEKLKCALDMRDLTFVRATAGELRARLALLESASLPDRCLPIHGLLTLASEPDSQVVVEFAHYRDATNTIEGSVSFNWGSFPLATVWVSEFPSEDLAKSSFLQGRRWALQDIFIDAELAGLRCRAYTQQYEYSPFDLGSTWMTWSAPGWTRPCCSIPLPRPWRGRCGSGLSILECPRSRSARPPRPTGASSQGLRRTFAFGKHSPN